LLQEGTLIGGRYELHSPLASGGNGLVFAATDLTTEKRVAIKLLGPHMLHERAAREKLRLEAIVAGRVESEHIVQVSDAGVDVPTGTPFLVMELLKGLDLQRHVEQQGPLEFSLAIEYLRQVASGLDKAHGWKDRDGRAAPIVHRDLKPENLFLTHREDGSPLVKILDFGLAKVLSVSATLSSEVKGTPLYMAPEQFSQLPVTPATDVWALGLIAFFFLVGKPYWLCARDERAVLPAVIKEVSEGVTQPATERVQALGASVSLPESFDEWFAQCVNLDPARRFAQASSAVRALGVALDFPLASAPLASAARVPGARPSFTEVTPAAATTVDRTAAASQPGHARSARGVLSKYVVAALALSVAIVLALALRRSDSSQSEVVPAASDASRAAASPNVSPLDAPRTAAPPNESPPGMPGERLGLQKQPSVQETSTAPNAERASGGTAAPVPNRPKEKQPGGAVATSEPRSEQTATGAAGGNTTRARSVREVPAGVASSKKPSADGPASSHAPGPAPAPVSSRPPRDPADHR